MDTFEFLSDEAIVDANEDRLKHPSIAETLKSIVLKTPLPFTIGLFGHWGSGKSSIANFLKEKLLSNKKKVPVVLFDVWKYENDSLRRQFLLELVKQLQEQEVLSNGFQIDSRLLYSETTNFEGSLKISKEKFFQLLAILISIIFAIGICILIVKPVSIPEYVSGALASIITIIGFSLLFQNITQVITTEAKTISYNKFSDPDEFEKEFGRIIDNCTAKRILIIFDNLDRTTSDKAIELLSTIKTFLEPKTKKCVFLIPCDEIAIKSYLINLYANNSIEDTDFNADEFLRKFFNTTIRIPEFIGADLEEYTKEQLLKTKVAAFQDNSDLVAIITLAFRDNPRQIKQFINTLLSHYLLAAEREKGADALIKPVGTITKNPQFLAKILIIKQQWSGFYDQISNDPSSYNSPRQEYPGLFDFQNGTSIITTDNLRAFIFLKQPSPKLAITGIEGENLEIAFKDNKKEDAIKIVTGIKKEKLKKKKVFGFIKSLLEENKNSKQTLVNILDVSEAVLKELGIDLKGEKDFCEEIVMTISKELHSVLQNLSFELIFACLQESRPQRRRGIISSYISLLGNAKEPNISLPENFLLTLAEYINNYSLLFEPEKEQLKTDIARGAFDNVNFLERLFDLEFSAKNFINNQIIQKLIQSIVPNDLVQMNEESKSLFSRKFNLILNPNIRLESGLVENILVKLNELINTNTQSPKTPESEKALSEILTFIEKVVTEKKDLITNKSTTDNMTKIINESLSRFSQPQRTPFIPILLALRELSNDPSKNLIDQIVTQYGQSGNLSSFQELVRDRDKSSSEALLAPIKISIENFGMTNRDFLDFIWKFESEDDKKRIITSLLNNQKIRFALDMIIKEDYKIKDDISVVQDLLNKAPSLQPLDFKAEVYRTIKNMKCGNDESLTKSFLEQLESMSLSTDANLQNTGFSLYSESVGLFSYANKTSFIEKVISWLMNQNPININHRLALQTVFAEWKNLGITHQDNLLTIVFDRILAQTVSLADINMANDLVDNLSIKKDLLKTHVKIIEDRIENEKNEDIKKDIQELITKKNLKNGK